MKWTDKLAVYLGAIMLALGVANATIVGTLPYTLTNGTTADASQVMANYQSIIDDVNANAAASGVNSDITALTALSTPLTAAQGGTTVYVGGTSTGTANAQVVASPVPTGMALLAGQTVVFTAGFTNTAAMTLNANALGAKNVYRISPSGPQALTGGEVVANQLVVATYDGTQYQLRTNAASLAGPETALASATTTDLGTIPSHNVEVTGTTTITGFGSSASTTYPIYRLRFSNSTGLSITYNATSMILPGAQSIQTGQNDTAEAMYLGSGNWRVLRYTRYLQPPAVGHSVASAKTGSYTAVLADDGALIRYTGTGGHTLTLPTTGVNAGYTVRIANQSTTSAQTSYSLDPNGGATINGLSALALFPSDQVEVTFDGTNYYVSDGNYSFVGADTAVGAAGALGTFAHGLGVRPRHVEVWIVCTTAEAGWSVGDVALFRAGPASSSSTDDRGIAVYADSTNVNIRNGSGGAYLQYKNKTTGADVGLTLADWSYRVIATP